MTTSSGLVTGFNSKFLIISPIAVRTSIIANFWPEIIKSSENFRVFLDAEMTTYGIFKYLPMPGI